MFFDYFHLSVVYYNMKVLKFCNCMISVAAINRLYAALGNPVLPGWVASAGDPCGEAWQGVQCNDSLIQEMYVITFLASI